MAPIGREDHDWSVQIGFYTSASVFSVLIVFSVVLIIWKCACCGKRRVRSSDDTDDRRSGTHSNSGDSHSGGDSSMSDQKNDAALKKKSEKKLAKDKVAVKDEKNARATRKIKGRDKHKDADDHISQLPTILRNTGLSPPPSVHLPDISEQEETKKKDRRKGKNDEKKNAARSSTPPSNQKVVTGPAVVRSVLVASPMEHSKGLPSPTPVVQKQNSGKCIKKTDEARPVTPKKSAAEPAKPFIVAKTVRNVQHEEKEKSPKLKKSEIDKGRTTIDKRSATAIIVSQKPKKELALMSVKPVTVKPPPTHHA